MPLDSRPRSFARLIATLPGSVAPTIATATLSPRAHVRRAADDLQPVDAVGGHLADATAFRHSGGVAAREDFADDDAGERRRDRGHRFDLEARERQPLGELGRASPSSGVNSRSQ